MNNTQHLKKFIPAAIIAVTTLVVLVLYMTRPQLPATPLEEQVWSVAAQIVVLSTHTPNLQIYGTVESPRHSTMNAGIHADVINKLVDEGDIVKKDQLLIELDKRDVELSLKQRQAEAKDLEAQIKAEHVRYDADKKSLEHEKELVAIKERNVERRKILFLKKHGSEAEYDAAKEQLAQQKLTLTSREQSVKDHANRLSQLEAQLEKAQALAGQAKIELERSNIKAPFDGKIAKVFVSVGNRVNVGNPLIETYDDTALEVRTQIPLQYVSTVRLAMKKNHTLNATTFVDNNEITLTLDRLSSTVGEGRSGLDALFKVVKNNQHIELGKTLDIIVQLLPEKNTLALPNEAFYGLNRIYLIKNQRLKSLTVELIGNIYEHGKRRLLVVRSPELKNGDLVMTTQLPNAMDGLKVEVKE